MKRFVSMHPLAGWLRPIQKLLLGVARPLRVARALLSGRDDPVATASVAAALAAAAAAAFLYSEVAHFAVVGLLQRLLRASAYAAGLFLFGPQNWVLDRLRRRALRKRREAHSLAGFDAENRAGKGCEIPNFKGSYLGRFPLVLADILTSDHLSERSRP